MRKQHSVWNDYKSIIISALWGAEWINNSQCKKKKKQCLGNYVTSDNGIYCHQPSSHYIVKWQATFLPLHNYEAEQRDPVQLWEIQPPSSSPYDDSLGKRYEACVLQYNCTPLKCNYWQQSIPRNSERNKNTVHSTAL